VKSNNFRIVAYAFVHQLNCCHLGQIEQVVKEISYIFFLHNLLSNCFFGLIGKRKSAMVWYAVYESTNSGFTSDGLKIGSDL
jgi:hypothetical protein